MVSQPAPKDVSTCSRLARVFYRLPFHSVFVTVLVLGFVMLWRLNLAKTILQGTVKGGRRQGRQRKRLEDNIREWTGLEFGKSKRAVENREKWRKLVAK